MEEKNGKQRQLNQQKAVISIEKGVHFDFEFSDEIEPFGIPYIYCIYQNFLKIVSPITSKSFLLLTALLFRPSGQDHQL